LVGENSQIAPSIVIFRSFAGLARYLIRKGHRSGDHLKGSKKGDYQMSKSPFTRTLIAIAGALAMSAVTVGAAVGPAQANANPAKVSINV
jgi:cytosine/uracil/thiamine/allantoin permease